MSKLFLPSNKVRVLMIIIVCLAVFRKNSFSQPIVSLAPVISSGLAAPIQLVNAGDASNRIFIVQQGGTIRVYDQFYNYLADFLTVSGISSGGERGLLSMAFHPDYETNGFFFVYYTNSSGDIEVARYHVSGSSNVADAASKVIVITIPHPGQSNHNGGTLNFGSDGYLYFATGDGGSGGDPPNNAQNGNALLGKMLRIAVNTSAVPPFYTIPVDNPYVSNPSVLDEIWDLGFRNPFRWSFDRFTHDMWVGDVGQDSWEEINYRAAGSTAGVNYGWRCYEGNNTFNTSSCGPISNYIFPVFTYPTQNPSAAVTGGVVYRGSTYPSLQGWYLAADFYSGNIYKIIPDGSGGWTTTIQPGVQTGIANFGETENGEVYTVSLTAGTVSHVTGSGVLPVVLDKFTGHASNGVVQLNWNTLSEHNLRQFEIEYSIDGTSFTRVGIVPALNAANGSAYEFGHSVTYSTVIYYRLKMVDLDGHFQYSQVISIDINKSSGHFVYPSIVTTGIINIFLNESFESFELISANGSIILKQDIRGRIGRVDIPLHVISSGIYIAQLRNSEKSISQKILVR